MELLQADCCRHDHGRDEVREISFDHLSKQYSRFKQKGRDEQCEPDAMDIAAKVCNCCGVDPEAVMKAFCKPRIKVGTEWVSEHYCEHYYQII